MGTRYLHRYTLSFLLGVLCPGCLYVPDALHLSTRESKVDTFLPAIIPGQTTKEEVYRMLGAPDGFSWNKNELVYRWKKLKFFLLVPSSYMGAAVATHRKYRLLITLDEHGVVVRKELQDDVEWWHIP
ncbi:MAG: hypothetical protein AB7G75_17145 [Candidatus Binatia bacterium]